MCLPCFKILTKYKHPNQCHMIHWSPRELWFEKSEIWSVLCYSWANLSELRIQEANYVTLIQTHELFYCAISFKTAKDIQFIKCTTHWMQSAPNLMGWLDWFEHLECNLPILFGCICTPWFSLYAMWNIEYKASPLVYSFALSILTHFP